MELKHFLLFFLSSMRVGERSGLSARVERKRFVFKLCDLVEKVEV